jgi:hypothetical protein
MTIDEPEEAVGVVRNSTGSMYMLFYRESGWTSGDFKKFRAGVNLNANKKVFTELCPTPNQLFETKMGGLTCFEPSATNDPRW